MGREFIRTLSALRDTRVTFYAFYIRVECHLAGTIESHPENKTLLYAARENMRQGVSRIAGRSRIPCPGKTCFSLLWIIC